MARVLSNNQKSERGITLVEVIIGVTILSIVVLMVLLTITLFLDTRGQVMKKTKALYLAEEGQEMLRFLRDEDWTILDGETVNTPHYFSISGSNITITNTPEIIDGIFLREFELQPLYRQNTTEDIVASTSGSSHVDTGSLNAVVRVGFDNATVTLKTVLTNLLET